MKWNILLTTLYRLIIFILQAWLLYCSIYNIHSAIIAAIGFSLGFWYQMYGRCLHGKPGARMHKSDITCPFTIAYAVHSPSPSSFYCCGFFNVKYILSSIGTNWLVFTDECLCWNDISLTHIMLVIIRKLLAVAVHIEICIFYFGTKTHFFLWVYRSLRSLVYILNDADAYILMQIYSRT